ncbi:MAG TPA: hypothetical protein DD979_17135 [Gammaproteobacteria bacterium]|jgi:TRAP-type mannitol/chloroaromatic compound transport system permease small subunit|nr:hypothetical protein [Gammaproteobacteria bacterium]
MRDDFNHMQGDSIVDRLAETLGRLTRWMAVVMVLLQFAVVVARYLFDAGSVMAQEAILYLFGSMFMLALADTLAANRHVRVDMLYHSYSDRQRRWVDGVGLVVFLIPLCAFMLWHSKDYVLNSWASLEGSRESQGLPGVFLFKTIIPVALLLVIAQGVVILVRCLRGQEQSDD